MRTFPLHTFEALKSVDVIKSVLVSGQPAGLDVDAIRKRIRVLDVIEAASDAGEVRLEDADWAVLRDALTGFKFAIADRALLTIIDSVLKATEVPIAAPPKVAA